MTFVLKFSSIMGEVETYPENYNKKLISLWLCIRPTTRNETEADMVNIMTDLPYLTGCIYND